MPSHKRNHDSIKEDNDPQLENDQSEQEDDHQQPSSDGGSTGGDESDRSLTSLSKDEENEVEELEEDEQEETEKKQKNNEYVVVKLAEIRKEVQCPICLGIIRKTRTVMECLHRFCRECIDKSMRLGNNECPSCRTHCASRRSLRDDPNYDALIAALYPDIDKYEEEELAFHEEEQARNKQIQASIAQTIRRQAEALGKKRTTPRGSVASATRRNTGRNRDSSSRGRRTYRIADLQGSDENEDGNGDGGKDSSSAEEHTPEVKPKRQKRGARLAAANADDGGDENESEVNRESIVSSAGLVGPSERLAWGKGGIRSHTRYGSASAGNGKNGSHTRYGSASAGNGKNGQHSRIFKLAEYLKSLEENDNQVDIRLMLVSLDEQKIPSLEQPYLCCKPTLLVKHLCQYIALQTALRADEIEIYLVKELNSKLNPSKPGKIDPRKDKLQGLQEQQTLGDLITYNFTQGHVPLGYKKKLQNSKS